MNSSKYANRPRVVGNGFVISPLIMVAAAVAIGILMISATVSGKLATMSIPWWGYCSFLMLTTAIVVYIIRKVCKK